MFSSVTLVTLLTFSLPLHEVLIIPLPTYLESSSSFAFEISKSAGIFRWKFEKLQVSDVFSLVLDLTCSAVVSKNLFNFFNTFFILSIC